jgi:hypothetical protein
MSRTRTPERESFLADVLVTAIEHCGYGFTSTVEFTYDDDKPGDAFAIVFDRYERADNPSDDTVWRIDIDTIAHGFGVVRERYYRHENTEPGSPIAELIKANRTNGDDGDVDVLGALLVLECALFGKQIYG